MISLIHNQKQNLKIQNKDQNIFTISNIDPTVYNFWTGKAINNLNTNGNLGGTFYTCNYNN